MTFFYLTNFSYVKTVLTIWSVSQFAIFKNRHVFADPITYVFINDASNDVGYNFLGISLGEKM